ncbi:MAG TPA: hypothetical protein VE999_06065 [Gemmataceae bacterium]|nr:hypothetical protein [Gemmataceae bacterium]
MSKPTRKGEGAFDPEEIAWLREAFGQALRLVEDRHLNQVMTEVIAKKVVEIARKGEVDDVSCAAANAIKRLGLRMKRSL